MKRPLSCLGTIVAVALTLTLSATAPVRAENRVVLISVDGLRPDIYLDPAAHGAELPNFRALMREGVYAEVVEGIYPSLTSPSHTTIVTGVRPDKHRVLNHRVFDPTGRFVDWYWDSEAIAVPALWDVAEGVTAAIQWPVTVGAHIDYNFPDFFVPGGGATFREVRERVVSPELFADAEARLGRFPDAAVREEARDELDFAVAELAIEKYRPSLLLVHVFNTDDQQHEHGREHREVAKAFELVDAWIGRLRRAVERQGLAGETLFIVTGDDGFITTHTSVNPNTALAEAGFLTLDAEGLVTSWRAMLWRSGGSAALMARTPEAGAEAAALLTELASGPLSGAFRIVTREELDQLGTMPDAVLALEAREGYVFGQTASGPLLTPSSSLDAHGYLPTHPRMHTGFLMVGPRVREGLRVPFLRQIDIAPTVAAWAGWKLGEVDGMALTGLFTASNSEK